MLNSRTYLYQRNGVFYIRLRMKTTGRLTASLPSHNRYKLASVSLRTKDRRTAMAHSRHIKSALKAIHADNPSASYEELREHLKTIVEWELSVSRDDLNDPKSYQLYVDQYDDIKSNLREAVATERLTVDQHRYINDVIGVLKACQDKCRSSTANSIMYFHSETKGNAQTYHDQQDVNERERRHDIDGTRGPEGNQHRADGLRAG